MGWNQSSSRAFLFFFGSSTPLVGFVIGILGFYTWTAVTLVAHFKILVKEKTILIGWEEYQDNTNTFRIDSM